MLRATLLRLRLRWPVVIATAIVLAGGGTTYAVTGGEDAPDYRTVTAGRGDVEETLDLTGLVDAARRSDLAFGTEGTVASVKVEQGEKVKTGQVIAVLETETLDAAVTEAQAALAAARAQLESDLKTQQSAVQDPPTQPTQPTQPNQPGADPGTDPGPDPGPDPETQALLKKLKTQQQAVLAAQSAASAALQVAAEALAVQTAACAAALEAEEPDLEADPGADPPAELAAGTDPTCDVALADVQAKQAAVQEAQNALATALDDLTRTLSEAVGSLTGSQGGQPQARTEPDSEAGAESQAETQNQTGDVVTAARLAADQAQIDQAEADLITAQAARAQATLRATRSGTLASLDLAVGDTVSTGSTVGVVVGGKAVTLTGTVTEDDVAAVQVGQKARVTVPGSATTTEGTVTAIGMTADSSTGTTRYPVTVTVEDPAIALPTGSRAQVAIVVDTASDVVTVPISAVTRSGESTVVRVWDGSRLTRTPVTLGAIGTRTVAVTDGVEEGDELVLADADQAIAGASSELNNRGGFAPGGGGPPIVFRQGGPGGGTISFGTR